MEPTNGCRICTGISLREWQLSVWFSRRALFARSNATRALQPSSLQSYKQVRELKSGRNPGRIGQVFDTTVCKLQATLAPRGTIGPSQCELNVRKRTVHWGEKCGALQPGQVTGKKRTARKPLWKCRKRRDDVKTVGESLSRD